MPSRGFQSSVDPVLNFGLGETNHIDSLTYPLVRAGIMPILKNLPADTTDYAASEGCPGNYSPDG